MPTTEIDRVIQHVQVIVVQKQHRFILPEHLLLAMIDEPRFREILKFCKARLKGLEKEITEELARDAGSVPRPDDAVYQTKEFSMAIVNAGLRARSLNTEPRIEHLVLTLLEGGKDSPAACILNSRGITIEALNRFISTQTATIKGKYTNNLVEQAEQGLLGPVIGRDDIVDRLIAIMHRKKVANAILIGNSGVGKTAIVEALAMRIASGEVPKQLQNAPLLLLDLAGMIAGSKLRGDFEDRLKETLESAVKIPGTILFIDEIHTIIGTGSSEGSLDTGNIIKPYLSNGSIKCIGATTFEEYRSRFMKDKALARRFSTVDVPETSEEDTFEILKGVRNYYGKFHKVKYPNDTLKSAIKLSSRYIREQYLPGKAIALLDEAGAMYHCGQLSGDTVTVSDITNAVCRVVNIPSVEISESEQSRLMNLASRIKENLYGQDETVDLIVKHLKLARIGLTKPERPLGVFALMGTTGCGKTELAKQLAKHLGISLVRLDMSEYSEPNSVSRLTGTSPGYVGFDQPGALTEPLIRNPHSVVLLDEIEKANSAVHSVLLQMMDEGRLTDGKLREASFQHAIILMTGNVGSAKAENLSTPIGFSHDNWDYNQARNEILEDALKATFPPEFRNRFTAICQLNVTNAEVLGKVFDREITRINTIITPQGWTIEVNPAVREYAINKALEENTGARPIERIIQEEVAGQLADRILLHEGESGIIHFQLVNNIPTVVENKKK